MIEDARAALAPTLAEIPRQIRFEALGQFLEVRAGASASKFNSAIKAPLADLVRMSSGVAATTPGAVEALPPSGALGGVDVAKTVPDLKHRFAAASVKGFAAATEVGSAVMGITLGAKVIANGVSQGDAAQTALGSITLASGVATMVGAGLSVAFAVGTPILIAGGVLSGIGLALSLLLQKTGDQVMGDQFEERWGSAGFLKAGWRDELSHWWSEKGEYKGGGFGIDF